MPYKQLIWDWNGTLLDDAWLCVEAQNTILKAHGLDPVSLEHYQQNFGWPVEGYYKTLGMDLSRAEFEAISHEFIAAYEAKKFACSLHAGAAEVLGFCQTAGCQQVVLSAYLETHLRPLVEHYGLGQYFSHYMGNRDIFAGSKVARAQQFVQSLAAPAEQVLVVGDTLHDAEVARACGVDCVLIVGGHVSEARLQQAGFPVIHQLEQLPRLLGAS
jgi:phosphoglycolate phosphatase